MSSLSIIPVLMLSLALFFLASVLVFWVYSVIHCLKNESLGKDRSFWLFVVFFGNWIGSIFYHVRKSNYRRITPARSVVSAQLKQDW